MFKNYDIILLQEVHTCLNFRCKYLIEAGVSAGLNYHYVTYGPSMFSKHLSNSGLLTLSRFPIIATDYISYTQYSSYDSIIEKGCNYCKVKLNPNKELHIFNTHLQSSFKLNDTEAHLTRISQLSQLKDFIIQKQNNNNIPTICAGDFNVNYYNKTELKYLYNYMLPYIDMFKDETQPSILIAYNKDGTENTNICAVCKLCKKDSDVIYTPERLDYIFYNGNIRIINKGITKNEINDKNNDFNNISDHYAMCCSFIINQVILYNS